LFDVSPPDGPFIASSKKNGPFSETWFAFAETISPLMFGLPNITGRLQGGDANDDEATEAFYWLSQTNSQLDGSDYRLDNVGFDASRSNPLYGASTTVQPASIRYLPCIKL
jgi:hypothetical protein